MIVGLDMLMKLASVLGFVFSVIALIATSLAARRKEIERRFQEGSKRMDRHDLRIQALEQDLGNMPGKDDLHRLELSLSEISGDMKAMSAAMLGTAQSIERVEKIVGRHEDHLREGK